jgi:tetratricopeptide (TPR) repeat protein
MTLSLRCSSVSLALLLCCFLNTSTSGAEENDWVANPSQIMAFADHLYERDDYHRAIGEYKRFIYLFPREPRVIQARFKIGISYGKSGHLDNAIDVFRGILADSPSPEISRSVEYEIGKCHFLGRDYLSSSKILMDLNSDRSLALAGWALLKAGEYREASLSFGKACEAKPEGYLFALCANLSRESRDGESIPRKSAALAAALSVPLPGAGRAYCGRLGDGIFSFLVVAASYAGAYHYYDDDQYTMSASILALGFLFHAGDVYGAYNSARIFNAVEEEAFLRSFENRHNLGGILLD